MIKDAYEIARSGDDVLLVSKEDLKKLGDMATLTQIYRDGEYLKPIPLQVLLKFLYYVEETDPPVKWVDPNGNDS